MAKKWVIIGGGGSVAKQDQDRPAKRSDVTKALRRELDRQITELSPAERRELVSALRKRAERRDEIGDRGGGVAAISVESAYGETRRLAGKEAGDPMKKRERPSFRDVLVDQQPTRSTGDVRYHVPSGR